MLPDSGKQANCNSQLLWGQAAPPAFTTFCDSEMAHGCLDASSPLN